MLDRILVFCDGASKGNPGPGGSAAILVSNEEVKELGLSQFGTNNRMELLAAILALEELNRQGAVFSRLIKDGTLINFYTDSSYLINGLTKWLPKWQANNWQTKNKTPVLNQDLWWRLVDLSAGKNIRWDYVGGHIGIFGNERSDEIASDLALGKTVSLYSGSLLNYSPDILNLKFDEMRVLKKKTGNSKIKLPAYSYLSLVDGKVFRDKTWAACEKRVKGKRGARYKKSLSVEDESNILRSWGVKSVK